MPTYTNYCSPLPALADLINNFSTTGGITNITNNGTGCNGTSPNNYIYYSGMTVSQDQGLSFNVSMQSGSTFGQGFRIWIDYNNDFDFADPGEDVFASSASGIGVFTGSITIPLLTSPGVKRMRVLCRYAQVPGVSDYCGTNFAFGECEDYNMTVIAAAPCTGTPTAGTAASSVLLACGDPFTVNLSGNSTGVGTTYQWQSSPAGMNTWTNLGASQISPNYTTTQAAPTDYQCIVSCTASGLSSTSTVVAVGQNTLANCYCIPSGPSSSLNYISGFTTTGAVINVANTGTTYSTVPSAGYANYTGMAISANPTGVVGINVAFVTGSHRVGLWADWNQDGDFNDAGENPVLSTSNGPSPFISSFTVPATALVGNTRLRVRITNVGAPSACGFDANGETEDYIINVLPCTSIVTNTFVTNCGSYNWPANSQTYSVTGVYTEATPQSGNSNCYDSIYLHLTITNSISNSSSVTSCDSFAWSGITYTTNGVFTQIFTPAVGCDSTHTLNLSINHSTSFSSTVSAIDSFVWALNGITYTVSGTYTHTLINSVGCDSIVTLNLTVYHTTVTMTLQNIVQTSPNIFEYDVMLTNTGNTVLALKGYSFGINHAIGMRGGGTLTHTYLSRDPLLSTLQTPTPGYTASTNHLRLIAANAAPGSEVNIQPGVTLRLATMRVANSVIYPSVFAPNFTMQTITAAGKTQCSAVCIVTPPGLSYNIVGTTNTNVSGGLYALTGVVDPGCFYYLNPAAASGATILQNNPALCHGQSNGSVTIAISGNGSPNETFAYRLDNSVMYTSVASNPFVITNLSPSFHFVEIVSNTGCQYATSFTIGEPNQITSSSSVTTCDSYTWQGTTYTASGSAIYTYVNAAGCDSVHLLNLNLYTSSSGSSTMTACDNYVWNGVTYTTSGVYSQTIANSVSCDSIHSLYLTIHHNTSSISANGSCDSYSWNGTTYTNSGTYTQSFINARGCDSLATLNLTINNIHIQQQDTTICAGSSLNLSIDSYSSNSTLNSASSQVYTATFGNQWIHNFSTIPGKTYKLTISGMWQPWISQNSYYDAAYLIASNNTYPFIFNCAPTLNPSVGLWINSICNLRPTPDMYNSNHVYDFYISAASNFTTIGFDDMNNYGDNSGLLNFTITEVIDSFSYQWSTGDTTSIIYVTPTQTTTYYLTSNNGTNSCTDSVTVIVTAPSVNAGVNQSICQGDLITLTASGADSYQWSNAVINGLAFAPMNTQTYTVTGSNSLGCTTTSEVTVIVNATPTPIITYSGMLTFCDGNAVVLNANTGNDLSYQWYKDGIIMNGATANSYTVTQSGSYTVEETISANCSALSSPQVVTVNSCNVDLHLKLFIQGYYLGSSTMAPVLMNETVTANANVTDSLLIELHSHTPPYGLVLSQSAILHTDGSATCTFDYVNGNYYLADSYYVAVRHRNGLTTWSANPVSFSSPSVQYDFTTASSQAYGDNMLEVESGVWAFFNGDLNADDNIDLLDFPVLEIDINNFAYGYYNTDLNGDGNVDLLDISILEPNVFNFIFSYQPAWSGTLPAVSTTAFSSITGGTAISGGNIVFDGGSPITAKGVCWGIHQNPTIADSMTLNGAGAGSYTSTLMNLNPNTTYYVRAYATNGVGTVYGNEVSFVSGTLAIGQSYQGGKIAYILQYGDPGYIAGEEHGLIAAPYDQGTAEWGCYGTAILGADGTAIGTGNQNTIDIINGCSTSGIAARICGDLILNGYSDWYLPSLDELNQLYVNRLAIGGFVSTYATYYCSSSEYLNIHTWFQCFDAGGFPSGFQDGFYKYFPYYVRAVRSF